MVFSYRTWTIGALRAFEFPLFEDGCIMQKDRKPVLDQRLKAFNIC